MPGIKYYMEVEPSVMMSQTDVEAFLSSIRQHLQSLVNPRPHPPAGRNVVVNYCHLKPARTSCERGWPTTAQATGSIAGSHETETLIGSPVQSSIHAQHMSNEDHAGTHTNAFAGLGSQFSNTADQAATETELDL